MHISNNSGSETELFFSSGVIPEERLGAALDLAARSGVVFARDGFFLAGIGTAARLELPAGLTAEETLQISSFLLGLKSAGNSTSIDSSSTDGLLPFVLASLPFEQHTRSSLLVPEVVVVSRAKGPAQYVAVGTRDRLSELGAAFPLANVAPPERKPALLPDAFDLRSELSHQQFKEIVREALATIGRDELQKVVVAREVTVQANRPFVQSDLIGRLRALYPSCATFAIDGFLGASPELLCRKQRDRVQSQPLAGTTPRSGDPEEDARLAARLFASDKERAEHRYVVDAITESLRELGSDIEVPDAPHILELRNVVHLASMIEAHLLPDPKTGSLPCALEIARLLHPTPAVGGVPRQEALSWLAEHEQLARDRYAGPVGFMSADGDGEFWVGIRSAMIESDRARLLAGVGIVAGSDPDEELAETQLKLQALLSAAVRP